MKPIQKRRSNPRRYQDGRGRGLLGSTFVERHIVQGADAVFHGSSYVASERTHEVIEIDRPLHSILGNEADVTITRKAIRVDQLDEWLSRVDSEFSSGGKPKAARCRYLVFVNGFFNKPDLARRVYKVLRLSQYHLQSESRGVNVDLCSQFGPTGSLDCYARLISKNQERLSFATHHESSRSLTTGLLLITPEHTRVLDWLEEFKQAAFDPMLLPTLTLEATCHKVASVNLSARFYRGLLMDLKSLNDGFGQDHVFESGAQQLTAQQLGDIHNRIMDHLCQMRDDRRDVLTTLPVKLNQVLRSQGYRRLQMPRDVIKLHQHYNQQCKKLSQMLSQNEYIFGLHLSVVQNLMQQEVNRRSHEAMEAARLDTRIALRDSSQMKAVAVLTMIFLPTTALASIFSMNPFFAGEDGQLHISKTFWLFWAVSLPLTLVVLICYLVWTQRPSLPSLISGRSREPEPV